MERYDMAKFTMINCWMVAKEIDIALHGDHSVERTRKINNKLLEKKAQFPDQIDVVDNTGKYEAPQEADPINIIIPPPPGHDVVC